MLVKSVSWFTMQQYSVVCIGRLRGCHGDVVPSEGIAESVRDTGDVYFVPAFSGLYAPYWQADARGYTTSLLPSCLPRPSFPPSPLSSDLSSV